MNRPPWLRACLLSSSTLAQPYITACLASRWLTDFPSRPTFLVSRGSMYFWAHVRTQLGANLLYILSEHSLRRLGPDNVSFGVLTDVVRCCLDSELGELTALFVTTVLRAPAIPCFGWYWPFYGVLMLAHLGWWTTHRMTSMLSLILSSIEWTSQWAILVFHQQVSEDFPYLPRTLGHGTLSVLLFSKLQHAFFWILWSRIHFFWKWKWIIFRVTQPIFWLKKKHFTLIA